MENKEPNGPLSWEEAIDQLAKRFGHSNVQDFKSAWPDFATFIEFATSRVQALEERHKIELSNYAYQMDMAKRERDKVEEDNKRLEEELGLLKIHCEWQTNLKSQAESALEKSWEENKRLQDELAAYVKNTTL